MNKEELEKHKISLLKSVDKYNTKIDKLNKYGNKLNYLFFFLTMAIISAIISLIIIFVIDLDMPIYQIVIIVVLVLVSSVFTYKPKAVDEQINTYNSYISIATKELSLVDEHLNNK